MSSDPPQRGSRLRKLVQKATAFMNSSSKSSPRQSPSTAGSRALSPISSATPNEQATPPSGIQPVIQLSGTRASEALGPATLLPGDETIPTQASSGVEEIQKSADEVKPTWGTPWIALDTALRALYKTSEAFPLFRPVVGTLISCLQTLHAVSKNRQGYEDLTIELEKDISVLERHLREATSEKFTDCVSNVILSIKCEVEYVDKKWNQGIGGRLMEVDEDMEELLRCYRRIESLFRRLKTDASLSTWSIANEHLANTRLEALSPAKSASFNSALSEEINRRSCTENTRLDVLAGLKRWSGNPGSAKFYWMSGMAGTGKTTIACTKCESLEKDHQLGASFFCTRTSPECRSVKRIVPTIAYQLARYSRPFQAELCRVLEKDPDVGTRKIALQLERLLKEPLAEVKGAMPNNVIVVIDALDECDNSKEVRTFLTELFRAAKDLQLKFFVTSRPEPEIRDQMLSHVEGARSIIHLHEIERSLVQADIELYLKEELASVSASDEQIKRLAELSGKLFIYAATAVRYICSERRLTNPTQRLQMVLSVQPGSSKKYAEIDGLYMSILDAALDGEGLEVAETKNAQLVLWTVVCLREPVTIDTLATLAGITGEEAESILPSLRSVLHVSENRDLVSTLHASFPDFIFSQERSGRFFCDESIHGQVMARQCFGIMKTRLRFNICNLESSFILDKDVEDLDQRIQSYISQSLSYSCRYGFDHLISTTPSNELLVMLEEFLSNQLLFWMEVLNLIKVITLGPVELQKALIWLPAETSSSNLVGLISNARDFVIYFSTNLVSQSTPHIYLSALPFCLKPNAVYTRYWNRMQGLIDVKGTALTQNMSPAFATWHMGFVVECIAVSPDGSLIAFGGPDGKLGLIKRTNGSFLALPFKGHTDSVRSIAFSSDGMRIVSGSSDRTLWVWNVSSGMPVAGPFVGHSGKVYSVAFSPDGTCVASGSRDCTVCLWNAHNGAITTPLQGHTGYVRSVAFSPDGPLIASGSDDCTIRVWSTQGGALVAGPFKTHTDWVRSIAFSPDGSRIVSGSSDNTIRVQDAWDGTLLLPAFEDHTSPLRSVAFSPNSTLIVSGGLDRMVMVRNAQDGTLFSNPLIGHTDRVKSVAFSADSTEVISGSRDKTIRVWKVQPSPNATALSRTQASSVTSVAFSPDNTWFASCTWDGLSTWSAQDGSLLKNLEGHSGGISSVAISADGIYIASGSYDQTVCVWDARNSTLAVPPFKGHTGGVNSVAFSPDGTRIASGSDDRTICVWVVKDGTLSSDPFKGHTNSVLSIAFSPNGMQLVSGSADKTIRVWNVRDGTLVANPFERHTDWVRSVAFSPDGTRVVSGSDDRTICIWNVVDGTLVARPFKGHTDYIRSVAFSPDGRQVVSGSDDLTIRLWNAEDGTPAAPPFKGHTGVVFSVVFSPDGTQILSGSGDGTIRLTNPEFATNPNLPLLGEWDMDSSGWAIDKDGRHLFFCPDQFRQYLPGAYQTLVISPQGTIQIDYRNPNALIGDWSRCLLE
ncbi:Vegetative incompatibility protein HET-E-1 [Ceratobasidium theobromae]|uniref:Vegetative incompatibility protein HET-E-1 n=1 Tax=Ceratobasidium theobromae TaxID=1582974 RepID=A0A5N5QF13_9AGAM|nr:Vegetative incompatibility protein HET-E-1 [Ceratobasidium theobromae]